MDNKLKILSIHSPDIEITEDDPEKMDDFLLLIEVEIGISIEDGSNIFSIIIATPKSIQREIDEANECYYSSRHTLILNRYDVDKLCSYIVKIVNDAEARTNTIEEAYIEMSKYMHWEYEDYTVINSTC